MLSDAFLQSMTHDIYVINMLDNQVTNPQLMNEYIRKFVSGICVYRDTKTVHMTVQLMDGDEVVYQKVVVIEWG